MPINIAGHAGFCMGVRRAVDAALAVVARERARGVAVYTLGELVHNPQVLESLAEAGVQVAETPDGIPEGAAVVIRSHGVSPEALARLASRGVSVTDLTCPFVKRLHDTVAAYSQGGLPVVLVGEREHPEVQGTVGWARGEVYVVGSEAEALALPEMPCALAVAQTTFPQADWLRVIAALRTRVTALQVDETICTATVQRQNAARELASRADAMLVVGGRHSANTQKLFAACRERCPRTLLVERASDIPAGFADIHSEIIGITAGASTPDGLLKEVVQRMNDMEQQAQVQEQLQEQEQTHPAEEEQKSSFMDDVAATIVKIKPGQTISGTVVQITEDEVCVNIGYKSDGLIKRADLVTQDVKLGDEIEVEVVKVNDGEGNVVLSQRNIVQRKAWDEIVAKQEAGEYVEGVGKEVVKGGLIASVNGIRAFIPASQLSNRYVESIADFVGQTMTLKIIEMDKQKRRIVASRKAVILEEAVAKKAAIWDKLEEGAIIHGIVRRLADFGAFVDIGGVDGLVHLTDLSWAHIRHPSEVVAPNQEVDVKILGLDRDRERIQLGIKQLQPKPWDVAEEKYPAGSIVEGKVVRITTFGAFVELEPGLDGLVHISQCALSRVQKVEDAVEVGQIVRVKVLSVDPVAKRISLSIREALEDDAFNYADIPGEAELVETYDVEVETPTKVIDIETPVEGIEIEVQPEGDQQ